MLLKDEFLSKWEEVSGFDFRKLLEDNQNVSLPMISLLDNTPVIFAFVYSYLPNNKVVVSQRHFWSCNEHKMMLCKNSYDCGAVNTLVIDSELYFNRLKSVIELLFVENLSEEEREQCEKYFALFDNEKIKKLYFSENKPLTKWATKLQIL